MKSPRLHSLLLFLLAALTAGAGQASWDFAGSVDLGSRLFTETPRWPGQDERRLQFSIAGTAEARWRGDDARASIIPYLRYDQVDQQRSLADLREAYWAQEGEDYELLVGVNTVFWGVTESVHLVDIINQTDAAADIDGEDKLGQPMINLETQQDWGRVGVYLMPYFRERTFPGIDGRLRTPLPVDTDEPRFESAAEQNHIDLALRYSHYFGSFDIGLSAFSGTSREPRLLPSEDGSALIPLYDQIEQLGLDLQYTGDAWLWKLESILRDTPGDRFAAAVGGFEYTYYQVAGSPADIGVLLELQYDGRADGEPVTIADNDLFAGVRLALNDVQDTALLAGMAYDVRSHAIYFNLEAERRLGSHYLLELRARLFGNADPSDIIYSIENDDYLQLTLSRYF